MPKYKIPVYSYFCDDCGKYVKKVMIPRHCAVCKINLCSGCGGNFLCKFCSRKAPIYSKFIQFIYFLHYIFPIPMFMTLGLLFYNLYKGDQSPFIEILGISNEDNNATVVLVLYNFGAFCILGLLNFLFAFLFPWLLAIPVKNIQGIVYTKVRGKKSNTDEVVDMGNLAEDHIEPTEEPLIPENSTETKEKEDLTEGEKEKQQFVGLRRLGEEEFDF